MSASGQGTEIFFTLMVSSFGRTPSLLGTLRFSGIVPPPPRHPPGFFSFFGFVGSCWGGGFFFFFFFFVFLVFAWAAVDIVFPTFFLFFF